MNISVSLTDGGNLPCNRIKPNYPKPDRMQSIHKYRVHRKMGRNLIFNIKDA